MSPIIHTCCVYGRVRLDTIRRLISVRHGFQLTDYIYVTYRTLITPAVRECSAEQEVERLDTGLKVQANILSNPSHAYIYLYCARIILFLLALPYTYVFRH